MKWTILIPIVVGISGILQGGLIRNMSGTLGLAHSLLIGNVLVVVYSLIFYFGAVKFPEFFPDFFAVRAPLSTFKWWYVLPSIFGFIIISGFPFGISKLGAVKVTVLIVVAQMITSITWDLMVDKVPMNIMKSLGLLFSMIAVACTLYS